MSDLTSTLATENTAAPTPEEWQELLDTPFENWPSIRGSFTDETCGYCGHKECVC